MESFLRGNKIKKLTSASCQRKVETFILNKIHLCKNWTA